MRGTGGAATPQAAASATKPIRNHETRKIHEMQGCRRLSEAVFTEATQRTARCLRLFAYRPEAGETLINLTDLCEITVSGALSNGRTTRK